MKWSAHVNALALALSCAASNVNGAIVTYSWSGTITPSHTSTDPWGLGGTKPIDVVVSIDQNAVGLQDAIQLVFVPLAVSFKIDGAPVTVSDVGTMVFADAPGADFLLITPALTINNFTDYAPLATIISGASFSFTTNFVNPPLFGTKTSIGESQVANHDYDLRAAAGVPVVSQFQEAVPEPASLAIWGLGVFGCALAGCRRRKTA